jgi:cation diffusion facilitator CzcD-associated flavoprotein CzcO
MPRIEGIDDFKGSPFHTGLWPHHPVDFTGKRVAVIGTGATGVQTIQEVAKTAGHLTVFQRTPNWCAPLHNARSRPRRRPHQGELRRDLRPLPRDLLLLPPHRRPAQGTFEVSRRGARGVLREALQPNRASASGRAISATC